MPISGLEANRQFSRARNEAATAFALIVTFILIAIAIGL